MQHCPNHEAIKLYWVKIRKGNKKRGGGSGKFAAFIVPSRLDGFAASGKIVWKLPLMILVAIYVHRCSFRYSRTMTGTLVGGTIP